MTKKIIGSGGGGQRAQATRQPSRAPDTLHSKQFATIQDLLTEGEIEGFATPSREGITDRTSTEYKNASLKDVFLDDTPVIKSTANASNPDDSDFNFQDVTFDTRFGTSNQTSIAGIEDSAGQPVSVGLEVTKASNGIVQQVQASGGGGINPSALRITLTWPQIQHLKSNGDVAGSRVDYQIQIEYNNGGYTTVVDTHVSGRTGDAYQRDHRIKITGAFPVNVKVVRITADSTSESLVDAFNFTSLTKLFDVTSTYPNSAYTQIRVDSQQFSNFPSRRYRIRGIKVRIPGAGANNSGTPTVVTSQAVATSLGLGQVSSFGFIHYPTGYIFNGTMQAATWCSCPAMVLLDLLTNTRYGFGDHITDTNLDLFSFVEASKYSCALVDDMSGTNTKEPRFGCNVNIMSSNEAFKLINDLASVMRCNAIWANGSVQIAQDRPTDASYLFNLSNVDEGGFSYTGASLKQRHTVISVAYYDMDAQEIDYEVVEDTAAIAKFGHVIKQVKAFACTSRGQAQRYGKAILFSEQQESELVTFTTSIDSGAVCRPGAVVAINDPVRAGARRGGRVVSATSTVITIDSASSNTLPALTDNPKLSVILPDGTVEEKVVTNITGANITVSSAFSQVPNPNTIWLITSTTLETQKFRIISVEENEGTGYTLQGLTYLDGKYNNIEQNVTLPTIKRSVLNDLVDPPSNVSAVEKIAVINNAAVAKIIVSWQPIQGITQYQVNYRKDNGNFTSAICYRPDFEIVGTEVAVYEIQVFSFNPTLKISTTSSNITVNAVGKTALPADVTGLTLEPINDKLVRLRWNLSTDVDVTHGGLVYVRHSSATDGTGTFSNSVDLVPALAGNTTTAEVPFLEGEYILKFRDDGGRFSAGEASIVIDLPDKEEALIVQTRREDLDNPQFQGTKTNVGYDSSTNSLNLTGIANFDTIADFDLVSSVDDLGGISPSGTYLFKDTLDLESVFSIDLKRHFLTSAFFPSDLFDARGEIDSIRDFDGTTATEVNAELLVRVTQDDPNSASPTYTAFQTFANGSYKGRGFQFKTILTSKDPAQDIKVIQLGYTLSLPRRTEQSVGTIASGSGAKNVSFANRFFTGTTSLLGSNSNPPSIGITATDMTSGDYFELTNISATGFTIHFKNSSNASINRNFTYQAVGFGKG